MKYWNPRRIKRIQEHARRKEARNASRAAALIEKRRTYTPGDPEKNSGLMLDALGLPLRRKLLKRLQKGGAMSLSKLADPFGMKLPRIHRQVMVLERVGLVTTHKRGRVRMCVYNRTGFAELAAWLRSQSQ